MKNIAVFVSGGGTNLQALIDAEKRGEVTGGKITLVLAGKTGINAIERANKANIPCVVVNRKTCGSEEAFDNALFAVLEEHNIDLIVLAGYLSILSPQFTKKYDRKIINIHPSLIPSFCGEGYYGLKVHMAALEKGVKVTGATVHFVNEIPDGGEIILQKAVDIEKGDTPEVLQKKVMEQAEWIILPKAVNMFCNDEI